MASKRPPEGKKCCGKGQRALAVSGSDNAEKRFPKAVAMHKGQTHSDLYMKNMARSWKPWKG